MNPLSFCYKYPHPAVTTDCCIFSFAGGELSVLLIRRGVEPYKGCWALPGGFLRMDETIEQCAMRELEEETAYRTDRIRQFKTYSTVDRDPRERVLSVAFYALVKMEDVRGGDDADEARWFPVEQMPELAFDHRKMVEEALLAMRRDIYFEPIGFELLPEVFSMAELQKIIETITGETFDRRNFYNKMRHTGFVTEISDNIRPFECFDQDGAMPETYNDYSMDEQSLRAEADFEVEIVSSPRAILKARHIRKEESEPQDRAKRRSKVKYIFNPAAFLSRKNKKGSGPITY